MSDMWGIVAVFLLFFLFAVTKSCGKDPEKLYWSLDGVKHVLVLGDK